MDRAPKNGGGLRAGRRFQERPVQGSVANAWQKRLKTVWQAVGEKSVNRKVQEERVQKRSCVSRPILETGPNGAFTELQYRDGVQEMRVMVLVCRCTNTRVQTGSWCVQEVAVKAVAAAVGVRRTQLEHKRQLLPGGYLPPFQGQASLGGLIGGANGQAIRS